jgi:hypothetical protein
MYLLNFKNMNLNNQLTKGASDVAWGFRLNGVSCITTVALSIRVHWQDIEVCSPDFFSAFLLLLHPSLNHQLNQV